MVSSQSYRLRWSSRPEQEEIPKSLPHRKSSDRTSRVLQDKTQVPESLPSSFSKTRSTNKPERQERHVTSSKYRSRDGEDERDRISEAQKQRIAELEALVKLESTEVEHMKRSVVRLERENSDLQKSFKKMKTKYESQPTKSRVWTQDDEKDWLQSRKQRQEDQQLLKQPLLDHLQSVANVYEMKNQCFLTSKPHFSLAFPRSFQRATALNERDRKENIPSVLS